MMKNRYEHRCQDSECGYFNEVTVGTCRCHKTREEMQDAERNELLSALRALIDICQTFGVGENRLPAAIAAIDRSEGKP